MQDDTGKEKASEWAFRAKVMKVQFVLRIARIALIKLTSVQAEHANA